MLLKQNNQKVVTGVLFTGLLTLLASCGKSSAIESLVKADPELAKNLNIVQQSSTITPKPNNQNDAVADSSTSKTTAINPVDLTAVTKAPTKDHQSTTKNQTNVSESKTSEPAEEAKVAIEKTNNEAFKPKPKVAKANSLPDSFPASFPIYPQAELLNIKTEADTRSGKITWNSPDNRQAIADYYQAELTTNGWDVIKPFKIKPDQKWARAIAIKDERRVAINLVNPEQDDNQAKNTKLTVIYQPLSEDIATSGISEAIDFEPKSDRLESNSSEKQPEPSKARSTPNASVKETATPIPSNQDYLIDTADFEDLDNAPEQLSKPVETVASLGILTPYTAEGNVEVSKFVPNAVITRGEYARWLIAANNRYYEDDPGKKIYIPNDTDQPAFQDVKQVHPDFGAIQGLAEAGLIPSRLTEDSTNLLFRPNAPLTREDLVTWKVPLDMRQALPKASIEAIENSWGFQDAPDIDSSAVRALYADFQNGDRSNIRRVFGFTTLFQPKKPVTRAEAAASLWYFGFQGDGMTAQEIWDIETEIE